MLSDDIQHTGVGVNAAENGPSDTEKRPSSPPHYQINNVFIFCEKPSDFTRHAATAASAQTPACWFLYWARLVIVHAAFTAEQLALDTPPPSLLAPCRALTPPPKLATPPRVAPGLPASDRPRDSEHSVDVRSRCPYGKATSSERYSEGQHLDGEN